MGLTCSTCWNFNKQDTHITHINKSVPYFTLEGQRITAYVVYVYDGDTIHIVFPTYNLKGKKELRKWKCRLEGIDTPELSSKDPIEKEFAYYVKQQLHTRICNRMVYVNCGKFDKYGRLLITIETTKLPEPNGWQVDNRMKCQTVNEWLVRKKYAVEYFGKTKQPMNELVKFYKKQ